MSFEHPKSVPSQEEDTSWIDLVENPRNSTNEVERPIDNFDLPEHEIIEISESSPSESIPSATAEHLPVSHAEAGTVVSPEKMNEAEGKLATSSERLKDALLQDRPDAMVTPEKKIGVHERINAQWAKAKLKAQIAFASIGSLAVVGTMALGSMKMSAEQVLNSGMLDTDGVQAHAMQVLDMINGIGVTGAEAGYGLAIAVPMVILGLAKLRQRSMLKTDQRERLAAL